MHNAFVAAKLSLSFMRRFLLSSVLSSSWYAGFACNLLTLLLFFAATLPLYEAKDRSTVARTKRAYEEGDIMLGVLMPMHKQSDQKHDYRQACGKIWEGYGIHRLEQFFRAVDEINGRSDLLPGLTLGYDVRDSCWTIPVALEQSIDFIRNKIGTLDRQMAGAEGSVASGSSPARNDCGGPQKRGKTIAALIGPGSSTISGPIQNVLQLFEIPEIDFGATAVELSDKNNHRFFSRVVPSDSQQARALVDIIVRHNWTYIHAIHTEGMYGENGMEEFKSMLSNTGACIAVDRKLKNNVPTGDDQYIELLNEIRSKGKDKAKVIVCFCDGGAIRGIFNATAVYRRLHPDYDGKFMVIGSDGWNVREDVVKGLEKEANGGVSIKLHSPPILDFEQYLSRIDPTKNDRNPWFKEFWEAKFNCSFDSKEHGRMTPCDPRRRDQHIDPETVEQDAKLGFVVNAVYALAYAFHNMLVDYCPDQTNFRGCPYVNQTINGTMVFSYLRHVRFTSYSNDTIAFDEFMDGVGRYEIMNYRYNGTMIGPHGQQGVYQYEKIGTWNDGHLDLKELIEWPNVTEEVDRHIESVCSTPCEKGKIKKIQEGGVPCCWFCEQCKEHEYIIGDSRCMACQKGWWPDDNLTSCLPLEIKYRSLLAKDSIVCVVFALFGVLSCGFVLIIFVRHNSTPVVKASTRELTYIILAGVLLAYLSTVPLLMKPTLVSCYFTRILPGFAFSLIFGPLATKTNRIARILSGSKKKIITRKPRFLSSSAQVVITCIIVGVECVIITLMLIIEPAESVLTYPKGRREVRLECNTTSFGVVVPYGFDIFLIAMCTLYAIRTRNMPENFKEAKFIGFCMYATCAICAGFVPIYANSESKGNKNTTMSFCISAVATAALVFLFYPKIYIMVYQPEKNTKSAFTNGGDRSSRSRSRADSSDSNGGEDVRLTRESEREPEREEEPSDKEESLNEFRQRLTTHSSPKITADMDDVLADKLADVMLTPTVNPPLKLPKPKTISELMHQRRMSVASAGSAERLLLAAALRHSRNSIFQGVLTQPNISGSHTSLNSQGYPHSKPVSGAAETASGEDDSDERSEGEKLHDHLQKQAGASLCSTRASQSKSSREPSDNETESVSDVPKLKYDSPDSADVFHHTDSSSASIEVKHPPSTGLLDPQLMQQGSMATLLTRPSPIPEEDEDTADNTSSLRGNMSPKASRKLLRTSSKRQSAKSPTGSSARTESPQPATGFTYVNMGAAAKLDATTGLLAPPLPPKPPKLSSSVFSSPSALANKLIDHLYHSARDSDRQLQLVKDGGKTQSIPKRQTTERRHQASTKMRQMATYIVPEGPPRPISPTELPVPAKRHGESKRHRVFHKLLPSTKRPPQNLLAPLKVDVSSSVSPVGQQQSSQKQTRPSEPPTLPLRTSAEPHDLISPLSSAASNTPQAKVETSLSRPTALNLHPDPSTSTRLPSAADPRAVLQSPMSSTSADGQPKRPERYVSTSSSDSPNTVQVTLNSALNRNTRVGNVATHQHVREVSSLSAYDETSSGSSPSTAVAVRIAKAERHEQLHPHVFQPRPHLPNRHSQQGFQPILKRPGSSKSKQRPPPATSGMTPGSSELGVEGVKAAKGMASFTSSMSSDVSQDTLADLPSIEELSITGMRCLEQEETDAVRFKEYMNNLGVDIDLSVFQSTEV